MHSTDQLKTLLNEKLTAWLQAQPQNRLQEAMAYALQAGGKHVRGMLCLQAYQLFKDDAQSNELLHNSALALEFIHTYSLIQDDLPAMDNDDYRRGKKATHVEFGEAAAILASDGLFSSAWELMIGNDAGQKILTQAIGARGVLYGQWLDLASEGKIEDFKLSELNLSAKQALLKKIHRLKTGVLIEASGVLGAACGGASPQQTSSLKTFGHHLGICFQITDDILDEQSTFEELGKTPGKDKLAGKLTYPSQYGLETSHQLAEDHANFALQALEIFPADRRQPLVDLVTQILTRKN